MYVLDCCNNLHWTILGGHPLDGPLDHDDDVPERGVQRLHHRDERDRHELRAGPRDARRARAHIQQPGCGAVPGGGRHHRPLLPRRRPVQGGRERREHAQGAHAPGRDVHGLPQHLPVRTRRILKC